MTITVMAGVRRRFPTIFWIARPVGWILGSRRRTCRAMLVLLAMVAGPALWWRTQLIGLPDIGDPFDVSAFQTFTIPDDRNAYSDYRRASSLFKPWALYAATAGSRVNLAARWSQAGPEVKRWAEDNREALAVYRQGTELPDALDEIPRFEGMHVERWDMHLTLGSLVRLALLEGSRLEELGDMEGAWGWYRAVLRSIHHVGLHGTVFRPSLAQNWHDMLARSCHDLVRRSSHDARAHSKSSGHRG